MSIVTTRTLTKTKKTQNDQLRTLTNHKRTSRCCLEASPHHTPANETMHDEKQPPQEATSARANILSSTEFGLFLSCSTHHKLPPIQRKPRSSTCNNKRCQTHVFFRPVLNRKKGSSYRFPKRNRTACAQLQRKSAKTPTSDNTRKIAVTMTPTHALHTSSAARNSVPVRCESPRYCLLDKDARLTLRERNVPRHSTCPAHLLRWQSCTCHKPTTMKRVTPPPVIANTVWATTQQNKNEYGHETKLDTKSQ